MDRPVRAILEGVGMAVKREEDPTHPSRSPGPPPKSPPRKRRASGENVPEPKGSTR